MQIILASASPRREEIFRKHGLTPRIIPSEYEEMIHDFLTPEETVMHLSLRKGLDVKSRLAAYDPVHPDHFSSDQAGSRLNNSHDGILIVSADTIVVHKGKILGKPADENEAYDMIRELSGDSHLVMTGVCLIHPSLPVKCFYDVSKVFFCEVPEDELLDYIATDEPYDKAGAYAVQETFSKYTTKIEGDLENIIGFPFERFLKELKTFC